MTGNALIGQSGGPTSVINSSLCGVVQGCLASSSVKKVYGMRWGIEGFLQRQITDLGREKPEVIQALRRTPSSALGSCRYKLKQEDLPAVLELLKRLEVRFLFLIGGNDTMDTINRIEQFASGEGYELVGVGVPKTVDNDLYGTDHTPGYGSAARYVALSVQQAGRLAQDMQKVDRFVIHQTVGRNAGWLAAAAALGRRRESEAPHLIYLPERPLSRAKVLSDVEGCVARHGWASVVVGEGIVWENGKPVSASEAQDRFANVEFGAMAGTSAAMVLHHLIAAETDYRGEFQVTESLPMAAIDRASEVDLEEAYRCGRRAVELAEQGQSGVMVSIRRENSRPYEISYGTVPLGEVAVRAKPLPDEFIASSGSDVTAQFIEYAAPLAGEFPSYAELSHLPVAM